MDEIAYFSTGLKPLEAELRQLSGMEPRFRLWRTGAASCIAGWGHKRSAAKARRLARMAKLPYLALEDGFLRSVKPGRQQPPASLIADRTGIYYDARGPSDLETLLETAAFSESELCRAREFIEFLASNRLSKYNHGLDRALPEFSASKRFVLIVDQTVGDASVEGALADVSTFHKMVRAARHENPDAMVVARLHPETVAGTKPGYTAGIASVPGLTIFAEPVSPWCLLELRPHVYTVSSQFGFEALMAGCKVTCFGVPFYAGWGLTDDRTDIPKRRTRKRSPDELAAAVYLRYAKYFDCWRRTPVTPETAADQLAFLRRSYLANSKPVVGYRIARWKRGAVSTMLEGPCGKPQFTSSLRKAVAVSRKTGADVAAWGRDAIRLRPYLAAQGLSCLAVEDGFLRSVGLGAAFAKPLSLVFDRTGLYFDPRSPSDIETILCCDEELLQDRERAAALRGKIVAAKITKYNLEGRRPRFHPPAGREKDVVVVPGQVADDQAVLVARPPSLPAGENVNTFLLRQVRSRKPGAYIVFKPHPDVEKIGRLGKLQQNDHALADAVATDTSIDDLLALCRRVETYSSLAGFEALLREVPVTVHGRPFYSGWGLTEDCNTTERRGRCRTLEELVAAALIRYPRYLDPVTGMACTPELVLDRMSELIAKQNRGGRYKNIFGRLVIKAKRVMRLVKDREDECW